MSKRLIVPVGIIALAVLSIAGYGIVGESRTPDTEELPSLVSPARAAGTDGAGEGGAGLIASGPGFSAIREASAAGKYAFLFFYRGEDGQTKKMKGVFDAAMDRMEGRAEPVLVDIDDPRSLPLVDRYGAGRAPMPLVLAIAPNGAVTRGLPREFNEDQLMEGLVSPCMEKCMGALQKQKLTLLCVHEPGSAEGADAMKGVGELQADPQYGGIVEVVRVDPSDGAEARLLSDLQVSAAPGDAITVLLAPPGKILATLAGAITKSDLVAAIQSSLGRSGCAPGAGSGCCPPKTAKKS
ncbi:MAG: hypothetical protein ABIK65_09070 [Candidatus Eisenbacteria bacterium]